MHYHWHWGVLLQEPYLSWLLKGLFVTIALSIVGWAIAMAIGTFIGVLRTAPAPILRAVGALYVQVFRNIPLLLQMFLWFFVLPEMLPHAAGHFLKRDLPYPEFTTAAVCLGFYTASRVAVIVQSGILSAGPGQRTAALASGMSMIQAYRYVLLPLAFRLTTPPLVSEFMTIFKNSSVALVIGVFELTNQVNQIENYTFQGFEAYTAATVLYAGISWLCLRGSRLLFHRAEGSGMITSGQTAG
jgi:glutamate/aspartate transport system permease protein